MGDLKKLLAEGDPVAREPGLGEAEMQAMRRAMLVEARMQPAASPSWWPRPLALGAALAACLALGISLGIRLTDTMSSLAPSRAVAPSSDVRRQLQITSPGGTRIIWTFHEKLEL